MLESNNYNLSHQIFKQVFKHVSAVVSEQESNEHLEFLGDSILRMIICEKLFEYKERYSVGELDRTLQTLIDNKNLKHIAQRLNLDSKIECGPSIKISDINRSPKMLADCLEALIAAIYLEQGFESAKNFILANWDIQNAIDTNSSIDSKSKLQQILQAQKPPITPKYQSEQIGGSPHSPEFEARVYADQMHLGTGFGSSKAIAEQFAAKDAINKLAQG